MSHFSMTAVSIRLVIFSCDALDRRFASSAVFQSRHLDTEFRRAIHETNRTVRKLVTDIRHSQPGDRVRDAYTASLRLVKLLVAAVTPSVFVSLSFPLFCFAFSSTRFRLPFSSLRSVVVGSSRTYQSLTHILSSVLEYDTSSDNSSKPWEHGSRSLTRH